MKFDLKVKAHRSRIAHWGHGSNPRNYTALCGAGSVSTGSRSASQFLRLADTEDVTCKKCVKLHTADAPAVELSQEPIGAECPRAHRREAHEAHAIVGSFRESCPGVTLYAEQLGIRAYVFNFVGKDNRHASITFDRYGRGAEQFKKYSRAQLTSNALGSVMSDPTYGPDWLDSYAVTTVDL